MLPVLDLGGIALQTRGLIFLLGFWLALWVGELFARRRGLDGDIVWNFGLVALAGGFVGARLAYAAQHLSAYQRAPLALFSLSLQSMAWIEGAAAGCLLGLIYLQRQRVSLADMADALAPAAAVLWAMAGLGALFSGDAYGRLTTMPWGIVLWNGYRHPVQLYEVLAGALLAGLLAWTWPRAPYKGWIALAGVALFGVLRLFVEGFRGDPAVLGGGLRVAQLWALAIALLALWGLYRLQRQAEHVVATEGAQMGAGTPDQERAGAAAGGDRDAEGSRRGAEPIERHGSPPVERLPDRPGSEGGYR